MIELSEACQGRFFNSFGVLNPVTFSYLRGSGRLMAVSSLYSNALAETVQYFHSICFVT